MRFDSEADFEAACTALVTETAALLTAKGASAAVAESLTGGLVSSEIVRVPGSSLWFAEGCVTYSEDAKRRRLGVPAKVLSEHTAVSFETALAMAEGVRLSSNADIAVSTTGVAGPGPDEAGNPEGLVYIGGATRFGSTAAQLRLAGSRLEIRQQAAYAALKLLSELAKLV
ncbi:MAG: nicotinamide-nucleotide amidohydrolase family protein [Clostridia bacterium]|nr:nicotinamide-nucleotide amidohydrolase family protein [Clostridia bacterium]